MWCIRAHDQGQERKRGFIDPDNRPPLFLGFFLTPPTSPFSRWQWPVHRAGWLSFPVSGDSSPSFSRWLPHGRANRILQRFAGSLWLHGTPSILLPEIHTLVLLSPARRVTGHVGLR